MGIIDLVNELTGSSVCWIVILAQVSSDDLWEFCMLSISATHAWRNTHPGAVIGVLELSRVGLVQSSPQLDEKKRATERRLRERYQGFSRQDFLALPVISAYNLYYKRFSKTYHVLQQVESIVLKGKDLPNVSPLVDSNLPEKGIQ